MIRILVAIRDKKYAPFLKHSSVEDFERLAELVNRKLYMISANEIEGLASKLNSINHEKDIWVIFNTVEGIISFKDLTVFKPKKIIGLSQDAIHCVTNQKGAVNERLNPSSMPSQSMLLDAHSSVKSFYQSKGVDTGHYIYTVTEKYKSELEKIDISNIKKEKDIICYCSARTRYRSALFGVISKKHTVTTGRKDPPNGFSSCNTSLYDPRLIAKEIANHWVVLGTTSKAHEHLNNGWSYWAVDFPKFDILDLTGSGRGMKGFRDWIGPICNTVLIYDNHPDVYRSFGETVPYYDYNYPSTITSLVNLLKEDKDMYQYYLDIQKKWIENNTALRQLYRIFGELELKESESRGAYEHTYNG